ncbi:MAG: glycosyltransferase [Steroidobacteraceae bacterium]|jgi:hypothetical protein|nr:glycosyltransferase [Steroidobacteraceae bacterium]
MATAARDIDVLVARSARASSETAPGAAFEALLPSAPVDCRLRITPAAAPFAAILAGFAMLAREGRVRLDLEVVPAAPARAHGPWYLRDKDRPLARLEVDGGGSAIIDTHDSFEVEEEDLARHDLYFKRSLAPASLRRAGGSKLRALAPLNDVRCDHRDTFELRSELAAAGSGAGRLRTLLRWHARWAAARALDRGGRPSWSRMHAAPLPGQPGRVLLMAGLWDPAAVPAIDTAKRQEWEAINRQRVECVRALRTEFGPRFHGGIRPCGFARRFAPDVLLPRARDGSQREFLRRVREHPVCVTSMGLHGSNGWRLAEFVAFSRAIVSEPLRHLLAGEFDAGRHYLEFKTPGECVAQVARLLADADEREAMARRNWDYYQHWQRPDRLALRVLALTSAATRIPPSTRAVAARPPSTARVDLVD